MMLMAEHSDTMSLFTDEGKPLPDTDIAHLFLCLHEYFDSFCPALPAMLRGKCDNGNYKQGTVLVWTLHLLVLALTREWVSLKLSLTTFNQHCLQDPFLSSRPALRYLCKGIYHLTKNKLDSHLGKETSLKEGADAFRKFSSKAEATGTSGSDTVKEYFYIHLYLFSNATLTASEAESSSKKASGYASNIVTLKPL